MIFKTNRPYGLTTVVSNGYLSLFFGVTLLVFFLSFFVLEVSAQTVVSTESQFNSAVSNASAGDQIVVANGTYSNWSMNIVGSNGTPSNPIIIKAETPGSVVFTGNTQLNIAGSYVIVDGFYWNGGIGTSDHVEFRRSGSSSEFANHCTIRNCAFNDLNTSGDDKSRWIVMYGTNNTVENCSFLNKKSTGACILVELRYQGSGSAGHVIKNNYFFNFPSKDGRTNAGDSEVIRIGVSSFQTVDAAVLVEGNYFKETDGENEIISNKSRNNVYRYNTFRKCRGSLVLRHGAGARIEGNYFLGENKAKSGGIRITDSDHVIVNNYMQGLNNAGDIWNNAITLVGGNTSSGGTSNGYQYVNNILVAFNTIYNADDPIHFNDSRGRTAPQGTLANNLVYSENGTLVSGDISSIGGGITYSGNVFGGSSIGISNAGITNANANFSASGEIFKPSSTGPAANVGGSTYNTIDTDIERKTRPNSNMDVGAHEVSGGSGSVLNSPIADSNVGAKVGCCFLNATGSPSSCSGTPPPNECNIPSGLNSSSITNTSAMLSWSVVSGAVRYDLRYRTSGTTNWTEVSNQTGTSLSLSGLTANVAYEWQIRTECSNQNSNYSNTQSFTTTNNTPGSCPLGTNLAGSATIVSFSGQQSSNPASNILDGNLNNRWSAANFPQNVVIDLGAVHPVSQIKLHPFNDRAYQFLVEGSTSSATGGFTTLTDARANTAGGAIISRTFTAQTVRYVRLTITGAVGYSGVWASIREFEVICGQAINTTCTLTVPGNRLVSNIGTTAATVSWNAVANADHYKVRYRAVGSAVWVTTSTINSTSYNLSELSDNTEYEWQVRAKCANGSGTNYSDGVGANFTTTQVSNSCSTGTNLALTATIVSFSEQQSGNPVSNILDGNLNNRWSADDFPQQVVIDLGAVHSVNQVKLHPFNDRAYQFLVEGSTSTATTGFTTFTDARANTTGGAVISRTFATQTAQYIRLTITGAAGYSGIWSSIKEFEVICASTNNARFSNKKMTLDTKLRYFPNPFDKALNIQLLEEKDGFSKIRITDMLGRLMFEKESLATGQTIKVLAGSPKGIYLLQWLDPQNNVIRIEKIIKQ
ncbi:MAG TPA: hypothetical protein DCS93_31900 [Microscillaceae bacterium]|nr:hypothetical protein [Microscillaceae bacterium]